MSLVHNIETTKCNYLSFIESCEHSQEGFKLTRNSETSPYALCFAIFGYQLLQEKSKLIVNSENWSRLLRQNILDKRKEVINQSIGLVNSKPYLQLLCFTLSALKVLDALESDPLEELIVELLPDDVEARLRKYGALDGIAGSGNFAMFTAILLLHAQEYLGLPMEKELKTWVSLHLENTNNSGFWGDFNGMNHLQFQNGYHQYEILEYLNHEGDYWSSAVDSVANLVDDLGHYAPYPGGGGCFDYDAVFILTRYPELSNKYEASLRKTFSTLLSEQNDDGGFCESRYIRPRSLKNLNKWIQHLAVSGNEAKKERLKYFLNLQRPKHNIIRTHWTEYSRKWNESDLWDSWFRVLTIARIDVVLNKDSEKRWGFINYPGIGYHHAL